MIIYGDLCNSREYWSIESMKNDNYFSALGVPRPSECGDGHDGHSVDVDKPYKLEMNSFSQKKIEIRIRKLY